MKLYLLFFLFLVIFVAANVALLDNLRRIWTVGYPLILLIINLDLLILFVFFFMFFRKLIRTYFQKEEKSLKKKVSNLLFLYVSLPVLFLNFATAVILIQSTKTFITSSLKAMAKDSESILYYLKQKEEKKLQSYRVFFEDAINRGETPEGYRSLFEDIQGISKVKTCQDREDTESYTLCVKDYALVIKKDRHLIELASRLSKYSKDLRDLAKSRDVINGVYVFFLVLATFLSLLASVWLGEMIARYISSPLERISRKAQSLASGDFSVSFSEVSPYEEMAVLSRSLEKMKEELKKLYQKLDNERQTLQELINSLPVAVIYFDQEGRKILSNRYFLKLFGENIDREDQLKNLSLEEHIRMEKLQLATGSIYIFYDVSPYILSERFKTWQYAVKRIAHEIKNPLTPITLSLERILRLLESGKVDVQKLKEIIGMMMEEIYRIKELVDRFREMSVEVKPQVEKLNIAEVIRDVARFYPNLEVEIEGTKEVYADKNLLRDFLFNLFNNSLEWGAKRVWIRISQDRMEYLDDGPGIEEGKEEVIFIPFHSENPKGMGIGLSVVKNIAQLHGWDVRAVPKKDGFQLLVEFKSR
ncbi:sensor histidine kinase [Thermocrinis minervae]|uniref:histidine kinase n=1 Tax=Thermocrinis minervae TaxID=381751 RepID=A0A1M6SLT6_9AQUI|nr:ATP-binding protein [Thermocrinis minervae]SHK45600.1 two-component system, NtrC family, nitrogen regulation sensor histidine kinase NtrY [Thermocrinis minervae]